MLNVGPLRIGQVFFLSAVKLWICGLRQMASWAMYCLYACTGQAFVLVNLNKSQPTNFWHSSTRFSLTSTCRNFVVWTQFDAAQVLVSFIGFVLRGTVIMERKATDSCEFRERQKLQSVLSDKFDSSGIEIFCSSERYSKIVSSNLWILSKCLLHQLHNHGRAARAGWLWLELTKRTGSNVRQTSL
jgi:hypothetical protein